MAVIQGFVKEHREKVRHCYEALQAQQPTLQGELMIRFALSPSGDVEQLSYSRKESTIDSQEIADCAMKEILTWKFPASSRGMQTLVGYPFNFNPRRARPAK